MKRGQTMRRKDRKMKLAIVCVPLVLLGMAATAGVPANAFAFLSLCNVRAFGATGNGSALDTTAVNSAIETCAKAGGGTVYFAAGTYLCGSLHLRSGVTLWIDAGATIKASPNNADFDPIETLGFKNDADDETSFFHHALIWGEDVERIAIVGQGTIDGNRTKRHGPKNIALKRCKFVTIRDVRLLNCPNYNISMLGTDNVNIDGVTILNGYADGIDPDACHNVRISNCHIETTDDAIVPKASFSLGERRGCENIAVENCFLASVCYCFKLGTESGGDFKWIAVTNCVMTGLAGRGPASGGIALESADGANIDGVTVSNITMYNVQSPIFLRLENRGRDMAVPTPGSLKNVIISSVAAQDAGLTCSVVGIPGHRIEGVTLSDIRVMFRGGTALRPAGEAVPENIDGYPDADMFGALPAYGLYCRHVSGLTLSNVQLLAKPGFWRLQVTDVTNVDDRNLDWSTDPPGGSHPGPLGPALVCDDVSALTIDGLQAGASDDGSPVIRLENVRGAVIRGSTAPEGTNTYLEAAGAETRDVFLAANDLSRAKKAVSVAAGARKPVLKANRVK